MNEPLRFHRGLTGFALLVVPLHQAFGVVVREERALQAARLTLAGRNEEHVAVAQQTLRPHPVENGARVNLRGHTEGNAAREVGLDETRDDVHTGTLRGQNEMNADRARLLREHRQRCFHLGGAGHHQIRQLVDHDDDVRENAALVLALLEADVRIFRLEQWSAVPDFLIEVLNVARAVGREQLIALLHFEHGPLEQRRGVPVVRDHLVPLVRQRVVDGELDHFRVDHQEAECLGRVAVDQRGDQCIHAHRLAAAGGAGNEQLRHLRQVGNRAPALEVLSDAD